MGRPPPGNWRLLFRDAHSWVALKLFSLWEATIPSVERHPLKKVDVQEEGPLSLLHRRRNEARAGREIKRIVVVYGLVSTASGWRAGCGRAMRVPHDCRCAMSK